jgi:hypothetical protein
MDKFVQALFMVNTVHKMPVVCSAMWTNARSSSSLVM